MDNQNWQNLKLATQVKSISAFKLRQQHDVKINSNQTHEFDFSLMDYSGEMLFFFYKWSHSLIFGYVENGKEGTQKMLWLKIHAL